MTDFYYTDLLEDFDSSAVDAAYYNVNDKTLAIVTQTSDTVYRYTGVPSWVWSAFKDSYSKGTFFATRIKRDYGPSTVLGDWGDINLVNANTTSNVTPLRSGGYVSLTPAPRAAAGTPKGLTLAPTATVTDATSSSAEVFPQGVRKATTSVLIEGFNGTQNTLEFDDASTVDEALAAVDALSGAIGVSVKVKAVTVHFE